jgi:hypothetical protein
VDELRTGSAMNCSINASATKQGRVGGVHDGVDFEGGYVGANGTSAHGFGCEA